MAISKASTNLVARRPQRLSIRSAIPARIAGEVRGGTVVGVSRGVSAADVEVTSVERSGIMLVAPAEVGSATKVGVVLEF